MSYFTVARERRRRISCPLSRPISKPRKAKNSVTMNSKLPTTDLGVHGWCSRGNGHPVILTGHTTNSPCQFFNVVGRDSCIRHSLHSQPKCPSLAISLHHTDSQQPSGNNSQNSHPTLIGSILQIRESEFAMTTSLIFYWHFKLMSFHSPKIAG